MKMVKNVFSEFEGNNGAKIACGNVSVPVSCSLQVPGPPSSFTTDGVGCWGESPVESLQSHFILTMSHWSSGLPVCFPSQGTRVQIPRGVLM
jgi:hypothetical protein